MDPLADDYLSVQHLSEAARVAAALQSEMPPKDEKKKSMPESQPRKTPSEQGWGQGQRQNMGQAQ